MDDYNMYVPNVHYELIPIRSISEYCLLIK